MSFAFTATGTGTDQELLDLCRAHIAKILATGQSYTVDGRTLSHANLDQLTKLEAHYEARIAAAAAVGTAGRATRNFARFSRD